MNPQPAAKQAALSAIHRLRIDANAGDREAIEAMRDIALQAAGHLFALTQFPVGHPGIPEAIGAGVAAAHQVARESERWPAALHSMKEIREDALRRWGMLDVGAEIGIRRSGRRSFDHNSQTRFALDIFRELDAIRRNPHMEGHRAATLPPLTADSLPAWTDAGMALCCDWCGGDWEAFPWPGAVVTKAGTATDEDGSIRSVKSAVRGKISEGLKALIP